MITIDQELQELTDARQLAMVAPILIPIVEDREKIAYQKLLSEYRNTKEVQLALVAECSAYNAILEDINYKINIIENYKPKE